MSNAAASGPPPRVTRVVLSFPTGAKNILDSPYYGVLYQGIRDVLEENGGSVAFDVSLTALAAPDFVAEHERSPADARLVIAPRAELSASLETLWAQRRPLVVLGATWPTMSVPCVDSDNVGGAREAACHLIDQGHQRIALLYAEAGAANTQDRILGYRRALIEAHLPPTPQQEVEAELVWRIGSRARSRIARLVTGDAPITAIFAAGYYLALEAMNAVRDVGLRIPEDISIIGYDDPLSAHLVWPALTTMRQPLYTMGRRATELLLQVLRGERDPSLPLREILPPQLIVRDSTRAASISAL